MACWKLVGEVKPDSGITRQVTLEGPMASTRSLRQMAESRPPESPMTAWLAGLVLKYVCRA